MSDTQNQWSFLTHFFFDRLRCAGWLWVGSWQDWLQGCSKHCFFRCKKMWCLNCKSDSDATSSYISERNIGKIILEMICMLIYSSLTYLPFDATLWEGCLLRCPLKVQSVALHYCTIALYCHQWIFVVLRAAGRAVPHDRLKFVFWEVPCQT